MQIKDQDLKDILTCVDRVLYARASSNTIFEDAVERQLAIRLAYLQKRLQTKVKHESNQRAKAAAKRAQQHEASHGNSQESNS
jgi:hypothetical protein